MTQVTPSDFTRINNDVNGNPRYVCHYLRILSDEEKNRDFSDSRDIFGISNQQAYAVKKANKIGGRKYHTKSYGGVIVFQSYNIQDTCDAINELNQ